MEEILLSLGVKRKYVHYALERQRSTGESIPLIMRDFGVVSGEKVAQAVSMASGYPYFAAAGVETLDRNLRTVFPVDKFSGYVPIGVAQDGRAQIAVSDVNRANEARNTWHTQNPRIVIASENTVQAIYRRYYADTAGAFDRALRDFTAAAGNRTLDENPDLAPDLLGSLLRHACYAGASDLYLWKTEYVGIVKLKVNGVGHLFRSIDREVFDLMLNKLVMENSSAEELRKQPQECKVTLQGDAVRRRYDDIVTRYGFRLELTETNGNREAVIRVLDRQSNEADFDQLGFDPHVETTLRRYIDSSTGLVIVTGPTGSGKTTTLYALLKQIDPIERSIQTIENPIEYRNGLWMQHELPQGAADEAEGVNMLLNALLRNAPDVILFGEVRRNLSVANTLLDASNTGHLVFTTLHTNNAPLAITRLKQIGLEMEGLASVLHGILGQRLVRSLCPSCKRPDERPETAEELNVPWLGSAERSPYVAEGCTQCEHTGFRGRRVVYELLDATLVRELIETGAPSSRIAQTGLKPGHSMWANALKLVARGVTSVDEVRRVVMRDWW